MEQTEIRYTQEHVEFDYYPFFEKYDPTWNYITSGDRARLASTISLTLYNNAGQSSRCLIDVFKGPSSQIGFRKPARYVTMRFPKSSTSSAKKYSSKSLDVSTFKVEVQYLEDLEYPFITFRINSRQTLYIDKIEIISHEGLLTHTSVRLNFPTINVSRAEIEVGHKIHKSLRKSKLNLLTRSE